MATFVTLLESKTALAVVGVLAAFASAGESANPRENTEAMRARVRFMLDA
jgi:hypothetical protein